MVSSRALISCGVALMVSGALAGCSRGEPPYEAIHVFEGRVADSTCGVTHKIDDAKQCTEACVADGATYVLVVGDTVHALEGNNDEVRQFAGQDVRVSASLDENTLKVVRIGAAEPPEA